MVDRDFLRNPGHNILLNLLHCQDEMARFTLRPIVYDAYSTILNTFEVYEDEFHRQMGVLLQAPCYRYLRIFWDVFHRGIVEEELSMLDNTLFLYPLAQYALLKQFLQYAALSDQHWNGARILEREQAFIESTLSADDLNANRRRRLHGMAVRARARNAFSVEFSDPTENFICFLSFCQECAARFMMPPADYQLYARLTWRLRTGRIPYFEFVVQMGEMLNNPNYRGLRAWWEVHVENVLGIIRMEENPLLLAPLDLWVQIFPS